MKGKGVAGKLLGPLIAAGTSVAAGVVAKKAPQFLEETVVPWLQKVAEGALESAGGAAEKVPDKARSVVSSGGDLAGQLTDRVRDATGLGDGGSTSGSGRNGDGLSLDELTSRSEDRAKRRAERRKATKRK